MNISKAKFDDMTSAIETTQHELALERGRRTQLTENARTFDKILDKIILAARGEPLTEQARRLVPQYGTMMDGHRCQPPTVEEILRAEIADLNGRIVDLESRVGAVVAVAQFAHEHK